MSTGRESSLRHLYDLVRGEQVTTFVRVVALALSISMAFLGYGPLFDADSRAYANPVFDGAFAFISPAGWGIWFLTGSALLMLTAVTGRAIIYIAAAIVAAGALAGWSSMIIAESILNDDAVLTSGALGLGVGTFTALIGLPLSPRQLRVKPPIVAVEPESGEVTPLRRLG